MARFTLLARGAAAEAIQDSGIDCEAEAENIGVIVSSGIGGLPTIEEQHLSLIHILPSAQRRHQAAGHGGAVDEARAGGVDIQRGAVFGQTQRPLPVNSTSARPPASFTKFCPVPK